MLLRVFVTIVAIGFCSQMCLAQSEQQSQLSYREILDRILISDRGYKYDRTLQEAIDLGLAAVPEIRRYLNGTGYDRALYVLSQIPEVARESIIQALQSPYGGHRLTALELAEPFLITGDQEVINLWTHAFCSMLTSAYELPNRYALLLKVEATLREPATTKIMECVAANLTKYASEDGAKAMIYFLGQYGEPGDATAIDAIRALEKNINHQFKSQMFALDPSRRKAILDACEFALANLGDHESLASFIHNLQRTELRGRRLQLLPRMHERVELLNAMLALLGDHTDLPIHRSELTPPPTRVCDTAVRALRDWLPEFPVHDRSSAGYYPAQQIAEAKIWVATRILFLQEQEIRGRQEAQQ